MHPDRRILVLGEWPRQGRRRRRTAARMGATGHPHRLRPSRWRRTQQPAHAGPRPGPRRALEARQRPSRGLRPARDRGGAGLALGSCSAAPMAWRPSTPASAEARKLGVEVHENVGKTRPQPSIARFANRHGRGRRCGDRRRRPHAANYGIELAITPNIWRLKPRSIAIVGTFHRLPVRFHHPFRHRRAHVRPQSSIMPLEDELVSTAASSPPTASASTSASTASMG